MCMWLITKLEGNFGFIWWKENVLMDKIEATCYFMMLLFILIGCGCFGYYKGFKKCKEIDDKIISELAEKNK